MDEDDIEFNDFSHAESAANEAAEKGDWKAYKAAVGFMLEELFLERDELNLIIDDKADELSERNEYIITLERINDSLLAERDDCDAAIKGYNKIIADQREEITESSESYIKILNEQRAMFDSAMKNMGTAMKDMGTALDKREILLWVYRDKMSKTEAIASLAKEYGKPISEIEKIAENLDW